ncbi:MAG: HEAT repeat domain-containing protein [Nitrospirae bacterium]|nr:HEAT repeat domain-containing protein [Nitrospirota bacterium]
MLNKEKFESFFKAAVERSGPAYIDARTGVLGMGHEVLPLLELKSQSKADWKSSMVGEILWGWNTRKDLFEECSVLVKGTWLKPGPKPVTGDLTPDKRASALAARREAVVPRLLEMLIKSKEYTDPGERDAIFLALGYLRDKRAVMPLLELLQADQDEYTRVRAIGALGMIGSQQAFEPILKILQSEELGDTLRGAAAVILGQLGDRRALDHLRLVLLNKKNSLNLRIQAVYGLENLGNERAAEPLQQILSMEKDVDLLQPVIVALGKVGDISSLKQLDEIAQSHPDKDVREAAQEAIAKIKLKLGSEK